MNKTINQELINKMVEDKTVRTTIIKDSFFYFFNFYYAHYVKYPTADFQKEIIHLLENDATQNLYFVAFRGSGKSTMITTAYPIWSILGKQQKKFCIIFCKTQSQAKQHMMNIRTELENNELLKKDLGPFQEKSDEWGSHTLVFKKHKARITVASIDQSIRGVRHHEHRPDIIICDDVEDLQSTKTREAREKTYNWLYGEVIPAGDVNTRLIMVGNLLHDDSLLMRIKEEISQKRIKGAFKEYPLLDEQDNCLWPGKYPSPEAVQGEKSKVASEKSWQREYLLRIIPNDDQVIYPEWIQFYDELPGKDHRAYRNTYASVDLAISQKESADFTAVVRARIYGRSEKLRIYILPNSIVRKINFPEQIKTLKELSDVELKGPNDRLFVETIAYQAALSQMLRMEGITKVKEIVPKGDKRTRLAFTATAIKAGMVKFPKKGCEDLISQLVHFGAEKHDDLADAFSLLVNSTVSMHSEEPTFYFWNLSNPEPPYSKDYIDVEDENDRPGPKKED
jgi:predicted phage terminase large subunit-like protein